MENKNYYEKLMEKYEKWEDLVKDLIIDRLEDYKNVSVYACDLAYTLFENENIDGSFTCSTYWSKELIKKYFDDFATLYDEFIFNMGNENAINVFEEPEKFIVIMLLECSNMLIGQLEFTHKNYDKQIKLDNKTINKIIKELKGVK